MFFTYVKIEVKVTRHDEVKHSFTRVNPKKKKTNTDDPKLNTINDTSFLLFGVLLSNMYLFVRIFVSFRYTELFFCIKG